MVSDDKVRDSLVAWMTGTTVGAALTVQGAGNCSAVYTGVGVVTLTLGTALDIAEGDVQATGVLATPVVCTVMHTSDTEKVLRLFTDAGAAVEAGFSIRFSQHAP